MWLTLRLLIRTFSRIASAFVARFSGEWYLLLRGVWDRLFHFIFGYLYEMCTQYEGLVIPAPLNSATENSTVVWILA